MIVLKKTLKNLQLLPRLYLNFANNKNKGGEGLTLNSQNQNEEQVQPVQVDDKYINKSAALYDHYVRSRQRPMLTLDNYQIKFVYVIERSPIYVPYHPKKFQYYRKKYQYLKKMGYYPEIPKQLQIQSGDYLFTQYQRVNPQNQITHRNFISKTEVYEYPEHSRYWRYTDPNIIDPHSIQTYSSDNVFLITKNKTGKWEFPGRILTEKDNHKQIFTVMNNQLFAGGPSPIVYFTQHKPVYARKFQDQTLTRGKGIYQYFFKGTSINGIPKFPTENYADYAWVPKPLLGNYFDEDYLKATAKLAIHVC